MAKQRRVELAQHIFAQLVEAVYYLDSQGIAHNNLTVHNVIVTESAEVKLVGFSAAKLAFDPSTSQPDLNWNDYSG